MARAHKSLDSALSAFKAGQIMVRCMKVRKTASHCPDSVKERVCTTENQIYNFYTGTTPMLREGTWKKEQTRRYKNAQLVSSNKPDDKKAS